MKKKLWNVTTTSWLSLIKINDKVTTVTAMIGLMKEIRVTLLHHTVRLYPLQCRAEK